MGRFAALRLAPHSLAVSAMKNALRALIIWGVIVTPVSAQVEVTVRQTGPVDFVFEARSEQPQDVGSVQNALLPAATEICTPAKPVFGHYKFESAEAIDPESTTKHAEAFKLEQEMQCVFTDDDTVIENVATHALSEKDKQALQVKIEALSNSYLKQKYGGDSNQAYQSLSDSPGVFPPYPDWQANVSKFLEETGPIDSVSVWRVTVYDNPPNAPEPGIYVAADYQNSFAKAPYHCGYLIWYSANGQDFKITREESGHLSNESLESIKDEALDNILREFGCQPR